MKGIDTLAWRNSAVLSNLTRMNSEVDEKRQSLTSFSRLLSPSNPPSSPSFSFELTLLSILQGSIPSWEDRQYLSQRISNLNGPSRKKLVDFIECHKGAAQSAVENNACKAFQCSPIQLKEALEKEEGVQTLLSHWQFLLFDIIPTLESVLYPLQTTISTFSIRRTILRCFRDRVLIKIFEYTHTRIPRLEHVVFTTLFETFDESREFDQFKVLSECILGKAP